MKECYVKLNAILHPCTKRGRQGGKQMAWILSQHGKPEDEALNGISHPLQDPGQAGARIGLGEEMPTATLALLPNINQTYNSH